MPGDRVKARRRKAERLVEQWSPQEEWRKFKTCELCQQPFCVNNYSDRQPRTPRYRSRISCPWCIGRSIQVTVDLAWATGFIEGDGSVGVKKGKTGKLYLQLQVGQKTPDRLFLLQEILEAGTIVGPYERVLTSGRPSTMSYYRVHQQEDVKQVLRRLWPFLSPQAKEKIKPMWDRVRTVNKERELSANHPGG